MSKIRIVNFGPIKTGYTGEGGWLNINKVTVFIGNQGSGKSTVAKVISTMTWFEKALVRGDFATKEFNTKIFKSHFTYQNIGGYFKSETELEYEGNAYHIWYREGEVSIRKIEDKAYAFPKIMYVPSERNFVSSVRNVNKLKGLPSTLYTFSDEFLNAALDIRGQLELPINQARFEFQQLNSTSYIVGEDYRIFLSEASSGFQSIVPLYIVSKYLAGLLHREKNLANKQNSIEEERKLRKRVQELLTNPDISDDVRQALVSSLSTPDEYEAFVNIVEEPEQNLFPTSQHQILNSLLELNNDSPNNSLVLTTHSPYIINYLTIAVEAGELLLNYSGDTARMKLNKIVPVAAAIKTQELCIYQLDEIEGGISDLPMPEGVPSDNNYLNRSLVEGNRIFDALLELQQELK